MKPDARTAPKNGMQPEARLRFAARAATAAPLRALLTLLALGIGVAAVIVLTSLGEGARRFVNAEFTSLGTNLVIVLPGATETTGGPPPLFGTSPRDLTLDDAAAVARHPAVRRMAPVVAGAATISFGARERDTLVLGTTAEFQYVHHVEVGIGRFLPPGDLQRGDPVAVVGAKVRQELFGNANPVGEWLRIGDRRFRVIGVTSPTGRSLGDNLDEMVVVPVAQAQALFSVSGLFRILAEARGREGLPGAKAAILSTIAARHEGEADITVITQDAVLATFDRVFTALTFTVAGIAAISLLVAGILVMNVMLVAVTQRTPEVGLLKALGATARGVRALFLWEAALLSAVGAACGLVIGYAGVAGIAHVWPTFPVAVPVWAAVAAVVVAVASGLLFGVWPASRAARLDPVAALERR